MEAGIIIILFSLQLIGIIKLNLLNKEKKYYTKKYKTYSKQYSKNKSKNDSKQIFKKQYKTFIPKKIQTQPKQIQTQIPKKIIQ